MALKKLAESWLQFEGTTWRNLQMVWPFFQTHSQAQAAFARSIQKAEGIVAQEKLYVGGPLTRAKWQIENLLVREASQWSWQKVLDTIESTARTQRVQVINFCLIVEPQSVFGQWFKNQGYTIKVGSVQKTLPYQTALVLGGGGAHGAYQVGVWQALQELEIEFQLITGTSVGALNGALIQQNDLEQAKAMWRAIETRDILAVPFQNRESENFAEAVRRVQQFALATVKQNGISTEPLAKLLQELLTAQPVNASLPLLVCTVSWPQLKEVVIDLNEVSYADKIEWLLASSAFYPMMAQQQIAGTRYVDGGYRNNIPVDVAYQQAATDAIVVDVKGPGVTKANDFPEKFGEHWIKSRWSLGDLLIFDQKRQQVNLTLGYLETKKSYGALKGEWYSFALTEDFASLSRAFLRYVQQQKPAVVKEPENLYAELTNFFKTPIQLEELGLVLLELWARWQIISPHQVYTIETLRHAITVSWQNESHVDQPLAASEWLALYLEQKLAISLYNQVKQVKNNTSKGFMENKVVNLVALFLDFLQMEENDG